jgi:hypothetical protein
VKGIAGKSHQHHIIVSSERRITGSLCHQNVKSIIALSLVAVEVGHPGVVLATDLASHVLKPLVANIIATQVVMVSTDNLSAIRAARLDHGLAALLLSALAGRNDHPTYITNHIRVAIRALVEAA